VGPRAWRSRGPSDHADTQLVGHSCAWALAQAAEQNTTPVVRCWFFRLRPDWRTNRDWHVSLTQTRTGRPSTMRLKTWAARPVRTRPGARRTPIVLR
jgi:hypothetical protein